MRTDDKAPKFNLDLLQTFFENAQNERNCQLTILEDNKLPSERAKVKGKNRINQ